MKTINVFGNEIPKRFFPFLGLGIIVGIFFLLSYYINSEFFIKFGLWIRISCFLSIFIYSVLYGICVKFSRDPLCALDTVSYFLGCLLGLPIFFLGMGLLYLIKFIHDWGFLFYLYI